MVIIWLYLEYFNGTPLQYSCLANPIDGGAGWAAIHGVAKNQTWLSDFTFTFHFHALEKEMATHSSVLAWRIPGTGEPSGLLSMGLHRVGHDWSDLAAAAACTIFRSNTKIKKEIMIKQKRGNVKFRNVLCKIICIETMYRKSTKGMTSKFCDAPPLKKITRLSNMLMFW